MATDSVTYDTVLEILNNPDDKYYSDFIVHERTSPDECIVVSPPEDFHHESPVEIWIDHNGIELFFEDEQVDPAIGLFTAENVATVATGLLQGREDNYLYPDSE